jgi:hypothetical protein
MKTLPAFLLNLVLLGTLSAFTAGAASVTVLDGFEESADGMPPGTTTNGYTPDYCTFNSGVCNTNIAIFTAYGGRSAGGNVTLAQYTATGPNDPNVTEGTHSMGVTFFAEGFGNDLQIVLSDTNSFLVEQAAAAGQVGRYILRYDVTFANPSQYTYFNQHAFIGADWNYVQISAALTNGQATFSCALDLPTLGLPAPTGTNDILIIIGDDFGTSQTTFTNCTIYFDNIRLVDTYAASNTTPVIYKLQSFETNILSAKNLFPTVSSYYGNPVNGRAILSQYATNGLYDPTTNGVPDVYTINSAPYPSGANSPYDTDFSATDGSHSLQVSNTAPGSYQADFAISFAGTKLAEILAQNLPLPQLAHYTLRWDTTMPAIASFFDGSYINMTYSSGAAALPMCQGRRENISITGLQRETYSVTLDQIAAWGGVPTGGDPAIVFFFDGQNVGTPYTYYYDNFELIDTAPVAPVVPPAQITRAQYNPVSRQFTLVWTSTPTATYSVVLSPNLAAGSFTNVLASAIPSGGALTTNTVTLPSGNAGFLKISQP